MAICHFLTLPSKQATQESEGERQTPSSSFKNTHTKRKRGREQQLCKLISVGEKKPWKAAASLKPDWRCAPHDESSRTWLWKRTERNNEAPWFYISAFDIQSKPCSIVHLFSLPVASYCAFNLCSFYLFLAFQCDNFCLWDFVCHVCVCLLFPVDIWSVGCIMGEMVKGSVIFQGTDRILHFSHRLCVICCLTFIEHSVLKSFKHICQPRCF